MDHPLCVLHGSNEALIDHAFVDETHVPAWEFIPFATIARAPRLAHVGLILTTKKKGESQQAAGVRVGDWVFTLISTAPPVASYVVYGYHKAVRYAFYDHVILRKRARAVVVRRELLLWHLFGRDEEIVWPVRGYKITKDDVMTIRRARKLNLTLRRRKSNKARSVCAERERMDERLVTRLGVAQVAAEDAHVVLQRDLAEGEERAHHRLLPLVVAEAVVDRNQFCHA